MPDPKINVHDKVAYSVAHLKSIGVQTGPLPEMRGVVQAVTNDDPAFRLLEVDWGGGLLGIVNEKALTLVSRIGIDSARHT